MTIARKSCLLLLSLSLLLTACGWHLRAPVNFKNLPALSLAGVNYALRYPLTNSLEASGVIVSETAAMALHVLGERWDKRTVAVSSQGRVAALELSYHLTWRLERDSKPLTRSRSIRLTSNVNQDPTNATAASDELANMQDTMRRNAIRQLQRQLLSISQHQDLSLTLAERMRRQSEAKKAAPRKPPASAGQQKHHATED